MKVAIMLSSAGDFLSFLKIMFLIALGTFFYFLPTLLALSRKHPSATAIIILNFLLGWTGLGWIIALIWSLSGDHH